MPPLPVVSKVFRVDFFSTWGANPRIRDRIFFQYSGALSSTDLTTVLQTISTAWNTNLSPRVDNDYTLNSITGTDLSSATAPQVAISAARAGTIVGNDLAAGTAIIIKFKIARRYRGGHPRFYLAGQNFAGTSTNETWSAANQSAVASAFAAFIAACVLNPPAAVGTLTHVNVSYFTGFTTKTGPTGRVRTVSLPRPTPVVDSVVSYSVNPVIGSQRRRNQQSA